MDLRFFSCHVFYFFQCVIMFLISIATLLLLDYLNFAPGPPEVKLGHYFEPEEGNVDFT